MARTKSSTAGSITARGEGRWVVRVSLGRDSNGKRVRVHDVVRGTRKDAQRYLTAALSRKDHGLPTTLSRETLGEWVAEWLKNWTGTKGPRTQYDYRQTFRRIFERDPLLGGIRLTALTPERIQQFISQLQSTKKRKQVKKRSDKKSEARIESDELLSPRTIRIYHGALRTVLNDAMRLGKVQRNVVSLVRPPKLNRCDRTFLSPEQTEHFLTASADDRFHALFATLLLAGLRPSEAFALRWSDLDGRRLHVQRALVWLPGRDNPPIFASTKTGRARTVALGDRLVRILNRHSARQAEWQLNMGATYVDQDLMFATELGGPLQIRNVVMRHFKPLLRRAKLPDIRLYDLRHSHATILHENGESVKVIQERLGHASITLTLDTYIHVAPGMQEKAADRLDALLDKARASSARG